MLEHRVEIGVGLVGCVGGPGATEPPGIVANDTEMRCEHCELFVPHSAIEIAAVKQDKCGPPAVGLVVESAGGDRDESRIDWGGSSALVGAVKAPEREA